MTSAQRGSEGSQVILGRADENRKLFVVCTLRGDLIRIISARDMTKREREVYYTHG